jgi:hypothetical protein
MDDAVELWNQRRERWQDRQERLGRFFGPGLVAELHPSSPGRLLLSLLPAGTPSDPPLSAPVP